MKKILFTATFLFLTLLEVKLNAQDGTLDNSFGANGRLVLSSGTSDMLKSVLIQPDGKIVAGGYTTIGGLRSSYLNRLNSDGSTDATFNGGSPVTFIQQTGTTNNSIEGMTLLDDGSIIYAGNNVPSSGGSQVIAIGKFSSGGIRSTSFPTTTYSAGSGNNFITGISYNKIHNEIGLSGYVQQTGPYTSAFKFLPDGTPDVIFGPPNGYKFYAVTYYYTSSIIELPNGSLLVACINNSTTNSFSVLKIKKDGTLDVTFGTNGVATATIGTNATASYPKAMVLLPSGKILLAGTVNGSVSDIGMMRLNANGTLDTTFPLVTFDYASGSTDGATSILIQPDRKIILGGTTFKAGVTSALVMRFSEDGVIDNTFGSNGTFAVTDAQILRGDISVKEGNTIFAG